MNLKQLIPILLTFVVFAALTALLFGEVYFINAILNSDDISTKIRPGDIAIGITIYLKTSIDFAIFIGRLMDKNNSLKGRIGIEIGTALGNALGTMLIIVIWAFLKEVPALLAVMIFWASLVLLALGESGLEHMEQLKSSKSFSLIYNSFELFFRITGKLYKPILGLVMPDLSTHMKGAKSMSFARLFFFSTTIPFILGLDDFAGYVSVFNVINILGFGIGVFLGHMILNIALFAYPSGTIKLVKNPWITLIGTLAFVLLAAWGFFEVVRIIIEI